MPTRRFHRCGSRAYSIFGNKGALAEMSPVSHVYLDGKEVAYRSKPPREALGPGASYITLQMMAFGAGLWA